MTMRVEAKDVRTTEVLETFDEHRRAQEIGGHQAQVEEIRRRAQNWRLMDCDEETLERMRHTLIEEIETLEERLAEADRRFLIYVESGRPLDVQHALHEIDRLSSEWEALNRHLQDVDEALLERHLRSRLSRFLGSRRRMHLLDFAVFFSIIFVVALTVIEFLLPLPDRVVAWIVTVDTAICVFLIADFFLRLYLSEDRRWYFRRYWIDLVASIPFYEFLRFGRLVRLVRFVRFARLFRLVRLGRAVRVFSYSFRGLGKLARTFEVNLLKRSIAIALALLVFGAISIGLLEGGYEASLRGLGESLWWSFTTVVTGGFADLYNPNTTFGRFVTVGLVLLGLTVTGIFTASLTSVLVVDDSTRIQQSQRELEMRLGDLEQKLDLLSGETNQGLIALETVAQELSNQSSREGVARVLSETMVRDFEGIQASVHLLDESRSRLVRVAQAGMEEVAPPPAVELGEGLAGRVVAELLQEEDVTALDLEPETTLSAQAQGLAMVCPLVAGGRVLGALHVVLPDSLARYYLYNRAPMTLAHHAAMALHAAGAGR
ncbi:MAG: ion transporter [Candidatus Promineifilaceae bacterium]|nr:ion transporter [Candidatus Promineifilaceae bacterium]